MSRRQIVAILAGIALIAGLLIFYVTYMMGPSPEDGRPKVAPVKTTEVALGSILPLSGDNQSLGEQIRDGLRIAIAELNARPKRKHTYRLVAKDSKGEPDASVAMVKQLKKEGVSFIAELFGTSPTLHALETIEEQKMLLISGITTGAQLSKRGGERFFRIIPSDRIAVEHLVRWAQELKLQRAAVVYLDDAWGTGLKEAFVEEFPRQGGTLVADVATLEKQQDFTKVGAELKKAKPDLVLLFIDANEAGLVLSECAKLGLSTRFMGVDTLTGSELLITAGVRVEGVMYVVPPPGESSNAEHLGKLYAEYRRRLGFSPSTDPPLYTTMGYDTVHVLARAIDTAGPEVEPVIRALESLEHLGASGPIAFTKSHDLKVTKPHARYEYVKGESGFEAREVGTDKASE